jgi:hypothetical protein
MATYSYADLKRSVVTRAGNGTSKQRDHTSERKTPGPYFRNDEYSPLGMSFSLVPEPYSREAQKKH